MCVDGMEDNPRYRCEVSGQPRSPRPRCVPAETDISLLEQMDREWEPDGAARSQQCKKNSSQPRSPLMPSLIPALPFTGRLSRSMISTVLSCTVAGRQHDMNLSTQPMPQRFFTIGWAVAGVAGTAGWIYLLVNMTYYFAGTLFQ
jgi:hypothetical protein